MVKGDTNEVPQTKDQVGGLLRAGAAARDASARQMDPRRCVRRAGVGQYIMFSEVIMKVVLIDNPKFISGILRKLFGIKKLKQPL